MQTDERPHSWASVASRHSSAVSWRSLGLTLTLLTRMFLTSNSWTTTWKTRRRRWKRCSRARASVPASCSPSPAAAEWLSALLQIWKSLKPSWTHQPRPHHCHGPPANSSGTPNFRFSSSISETAAWHFPCSAQASLPLPPVVESQQGVDVRRRGGGRSRPR